MHHPTYNESQAEPERINIEEHETKRSGAPASRLGGRPGPLSVTKFPAAIQRRPMGYTHLTLADRIELEGAVRRGDPQNLIAERPCRSPSTLSRELTLNGGREHYRALAAQQSAPPAQPRPGAIFARSRPIPRCTPPCARPCAAAGRPKRFTRDRR